MKEYKWLLITAVGSTVLVLVFLFVWGIVGIDVPTWVFFVVGIIWVIPISMLSLVLQVEERKCKRCKIPMSRTGERQQTAQHLKSAGIRYKSMYACPRCKSTKWVYEDF